MYSRSVTYDSMCPLGLYSPPDSSVRGMLQAIILEWIATPSSGGSSQPRDRIHISASPALGGGFFTIAPPVNRVLRLMQLVTTNLVAWRRHWRPTPALLPGKSHGRRSLVGYGPWGLKESDTTERLPFHSSLSCFGEGNGNPLQCCYLENPRDGGAWWVADYGVTQSQTQLKQQQ